MKTIIGKNLERLRGSKYNQIDVATAIGVNVATYNRLENGKQWPKYTNLKALAVFYGVEEGTLFTKGVNISRVSSSDLIEMLSARLALIDLVPPDLLEAIKAMPPDKLKAFWDAVRMCL